MPVRKVPARQKTGKFSLFFSHIRVIWSFTALWRDPSDVLRWIFDVAGFAVNAVLTVDDEAFLTPGLNDFIDPSRTIALGRFLVFGHVDVDRDRRITADTGAGSSARTASPNRWEYYY